jgi:H+/Cl- antiporter ClcA
MVVAVALRSAWYSSIEFFIRSFLRLRGLVRRNEAWFIALAASVGAVAGLSVTVLLGSVNLLHQLFFGRSETSSLTSLASPYLVLVPVAGGLIIGISGIYVRKWFSKRPVDPIEPMRCKAPGCRSRTACSLPSVLRLSAQRR